MTIRLAIRATVAASALLVVASSNARGEDACKADVVKFCDEVLPGADRINVCLEAHQKELSAGCQQQLASERWVAAPAHAAREQACKADVVKFCDEVLPGAGRIIVCLEAHQKELSVPCQEQLAAAQGRVACKVDTERFCKDVKPGQGRIVECLKAHEADLSPDCRSWRAKKHGR